MDVNQLVGYGLAVLVGISLGLMGSGGSILTVPILVYIVGVSPVLATAYSLFIVGTTALTGTIKNLRDKNIDFTKVLLFGIPSMISVFFTRLVIVPSLPETLFFIGSYEVRKPVAIMAFFAVVMFFAAVSMLRAPKDGASRDTEKLNYAALIGLGIVIGVVAGLVGAGGGFLIIPALVILAKTPMKRAAGTSLGIVAVQSLIGFSGDLQAAQAIDWVFLMAFTASSVIGIFIGLRLSKKIPGEKIKKGFGWFVIAVAAYILLKEFVLG